VRVRVASPPCQVPARQVLAMAKQRLDAHLHVWASKEDAESGKFAFAVRGACASHAVTKRPGLAAGCLMLKKCPVQRGAI
jgi:hypothetical protein